MMYIITDSYYIHIYTDGLLLYSSGREILLLIFITFSGAPGTCLVLILASRWSYLSICYRLVSFQQLSCLLPSAPKLAVLFKKQMALKDSSCILPSCLLSSYCWPSWPTPWPTLWPTPCLTPWAAPWPKPWLPWSTPWWVFLEFLLHADSPATCSSPG